MQHLHYWKLKWIRLTKKVKKISLKFPESYIRVWVCNFICFDSNENSWKKNLKADCCLAWFLSLIQALLKPHSGLTEVWFIIGWASFSLDRNLKEAWIRLVESLIQTLSKLYTGLTESLYWAWLKPDSGFTNVWFRLEEKLYKPEDWNQI